MSVWLFIIYKDLFTLPNFICSSQQPWAVEKIRTQSHSDSKYWGCIWNHNQCSWEDCAGWQSRRTLSSPTLRRTPKSQWTDEQPSVKKDWDLPKKLFFFSSKDIKKEFNEMVGGAHSWYNQTPYLSEWATHKLGDNYITGVLSQSENSEPTLASSASDSDVGRRSLQSIWLWGQWGLIVRVSQDWGNRDYILEGCTQGLMCTRNKNSDFIGG